MRLSLLLAFAGVLPAQQVVAPATDVRHAVLATKDGLTLPAGDFSVADLISAVSGYLCRNYLFEPDVVDKVPGFTLQRSISLDALGSEEMLYSLLAARGLTALPIDELRGVFQIVPLAQDRRTLPVTNVPWRTPEEILRRPRLRELVMTAMTLRHADAQQLMNALRAQFSLQGMWQPGVPTASASGTDTLLLHGYRDQIAPLLLVVQQIDRLAEPRPAPATVTPPASDELLRRLAALEQEVAALRAERPRPVAPPPTSPVPTTSR